MRRSRQRDRILEILRGTRSHPTAEWVYGQLRRESPHVSLGTVYRNLEVLAEMGQIQKLELGGTVKRFDWNPQRHYHIRCLQCGYAANREVAKGIKEEEAGEPGSLERIATPGCTSMAK